MPNPRWWEFEDAAVDLANRASLGLDPDYRTVARSRMDLTRRLHLDLGIRGVDDLEEAAAIRGDGVDPSPFDQLRELLPVGPQRLVLLGRRAPQQRAPDLAVGDLLL